MLRGRTRIYRFSRIEDIEAFSLQKFVDNGNIDGTIDQQRQHQTVLPSTGAIYIVYRRHMQAGVQFESAHRKL